MAGTGPPSAPQQILSEKDNHDGITEDVFVDAMNKFRLANAKNLIINSISLLPYINNIIHVNTQQHNVIYMTMRDLKQSRLLVPRIHKIFHLYSLDGNSLLCK